MAQRLLSRAGLSFERTPGQKGAVVLVHGIPGAGAAWSEVRAALGSRSEVIVPDLIGFGDSVVPATFTVDALGPEPQSRALEGLLDEVADQPAVLVGHDFGGPVAVLLAARRPDLVSSLVVLAANMFPDTPIPFPLSLVASPVVGGLASRLLFSRPSLTMMLRQGVAAGPAPDASRYLGPRNQQRAIAAIFTGALQRLYELYAPVESALRDLAMPVVVGWGDKDPFFPVTQGQRTAKTAGGRLAVFHGAGHFLPHERPEQIATEIGTLIGERTR